MLESKLTIFLGRQSGPLVAIGKNQCRMLVFAERHRGWHTIGRGKADKRAAAGLQRRGCIEINGNQFRLVES